ncbi:DUF6923 family protein, partial [Pontibacillus litoralis]|uniref:DUF6923 family protein n=1 Tax=Pontibacillus litoralis TaxID=516703 RepID=UPI00055C280A
GTVFEDVNQNGTYDPPGDPGIPNVTVVVEDPNGNCTTTMTDGLGDYTFPGLTIVGTYTVYETVADPGIACPPTLFTQPPGYTTSTTSRVRTIDVTQTDIDTNQAFTENFGHEDVESFECSPTGLQVALNPSRLFEINLVTGASTLQGFLSPAVVYNAVGFSVVDNAIYGYNQNSLNVARINPDLTVTNFGPVPNLPVQGFNVGDVDFDGHLYLYNQNDTRFYVVDVDPDSPTFLQLVDPTAGFVLDTAPFGTATTAQSIQDWAFNPIDNQLYSVLANGTAVIRTDPLSGAQTVFPAIGLPPGPYGAVFFDGQGFLYALDNTSGQIYRIEIIGPNAVGTLFSTTVPAVNNDGARCAFALLNLLEITKSVDPTLACPGDRLMYTIEIENVGAILDAENVIVIDDIPAGTTFIPGSVTVNGMPTGDDPSVGISLGNIPPGGMVTITYEVVVDDFGTFPITNVASVSGDNVEETFSNEVITNQAMTNVSVVKEAEPQLIDCGDIITYTITITNEGPDSSGQIILKDPEPSGTNFIKGSVVIDNVLVPDANPNAGIPIGSLAVGESKTISFQVVSEMDDCFIPNTADVMYCIDQSATSNQVITIVCCNCD